MNHLLPDSYTNFVGSALMLFATFLAFLSLFPVLRNSCLKLFAILSLSALATFSNHWTTYFAAIFIIATAVTELEFLHVLAAIIRGDKNYFEFRREYLTKEEAIKKSEESVEETVTTKEFDSKVVVSNSEGTRELHPTLLRKLSFEIESKALKWAEIRDNTPIQKYVRFTNDNGTVELDGFVDGKRFSPDRIYEVKWLRNEKNAFSFLTHVSRAIIELHNRYKGITKRKPKFILLFITPNKLEVDPARLQRIDRRFKEANVDCDLVMVNYEDIGFNAQQDG